MRERLRYLNRVIGEHALELSISEEEFERLQRELRRHSDPARRPIELSGRSLVRIFNDGSFERGGRFYGGWWQGVPQHYRMHITIDGEPTVEADYSAIHPRLLYAREGMDCCGDPYDVGLDPRHRSWVKH